MGNLRQAASDLFAEKLKQASIPRKAEQASVLPKSRYYKHPFYSTEEWMSARSRVLTRDGRKCVRCFGINNLNVDHIIPRSKVPALALDDINLQVLCWPCNRAKANRVEVDWTL